MLGYLPTLSNDLSTNRFKKTRFLVGDYQVTSYNWSHSTKWIKVGSGKTSFTLENNFIIETVNLVRDGGLIKMRNTIARDKEKDTYNMQTLNLSTGIMEVYRGVMVDNVLIFTNSESGIKVKDEFGECLNIKLIYKQLSFSENELIVGCSKDDGKTWIPMLKNYYRRA